MDSLNKVKPEKAAQREPLEKRAGFGVEKKGEVVPEKEKVEKRELEKLPSEVVELIGPPTVGQPGIDITDSPLHQTVEAILEEDLENLYLAMDERHQEEFKKKGEETASQIVKLIQVAKTTFKKIFNLIKSWLKIIPGVNKFFIEQEAKIKADRIMEIEK